MTYCVSLFNLYTNRSVEQVFRDVTYVLEQLYFLVNIDRVQ